MVFFWQEGRPREKKIPHGKYVHPNMDIGQVKWSFCVGIWPQGEGRFKMKICSREKMGAWQSTK
jgi:hypothetical protein